VQAGIEFLQAHRRQLARLSQPLLSGHLSPRIHVPTHDIWADAGEHQWTIVIVMAGTARRLFRKSAQSCTSADDNGLRFDGHPIRHISY
jgi:hypothetical protein